MTFGLLLGIAVAAAVCSSPLIAGSILHGDHWRITGAYYVGSFAVVYLLVAAARASG